MAFHVIDHDTKTIDDLNAKVPPIDGSGTEQDPFLVGDSMLLKIGIDSNYPLDAYYKQIKDIDLSSVPSWTPIGTTPLPLPSETPFTGHYDGNNYEIQNLNIDETTSLPAYGKGLFGLNKGIIENVKLTNVNITYSNGNSSSNFYGGIAGKNEGNGIIKNCYVQGDINFDVSIGSQSQVGLIVGVNRSIIENCYSEGNVTGRQYVGGICGANGVGQSYEAVVRNCWSTSNVVVGSFNNAGGIVGQNWGIVEYCYSTGTVGGLPGTGSSGIGGIVGLNQYQSLLECSIVQNCYFTGSIINVSNSSGGIIGNAQRMLSYMSYVKCYNCYSKITATGEGTGGDINGYSGTSFTNEYTLQSWHEDPSKWLDNEAWDFTNIWKWDSLNNRPILQWQD